VTDDRQAAKGQPERPGRLLAFRAIALGLVAGLVLTELGLRLALPPNTKHFVHPPNLTVQFRPDPRLLPGLSPTARYSTNSLGLRGREPDPGARAYRILAVGGSTTQCVYVDDVKTWPALVEQRLERGAGHPSVWVGNAGASGAGSRDHAVVVKYLVGELPRIDVVLVLAGVNDLTVRLSAGDQSAPSPPITEPGAEAMQLRHAFARVPRRVHEATDAPEPTRAAFFKNTALYQQAKAFRDVVTTLLASRGLTQDEVGHNLEQWRT